MGRREGEQKISRHNSRELFVGHFFPEDEGWFLLVLSCASPKVVEIKSPLDEKKTCDELENSVAEAQKFVADEFVDAVSDGSDTAAAGSPGEGGIPFFPRVCYFGQVAAPSRPARYHSRSGS